MAIYYVLCDDDCRHEGMTREQILAAIEQALEQGFVSDPEQAVFSKIKELRANATTQIWLGTEAEFNAIEPAPEVGKALVRIGTDGVLYMCSDDTTLENLEKLENVASKTGDTYSGMHVYEIKGDGDGIKFVREIDGEMHTFTMLLAEDGEAVFVYRSPNGNFGHFSLGEDGMRISKPLAIEEGGTGATSRKAALKNLGIFIGATEEEAEIPENPDEGMIWIKIEAEGA